MPIRKKLTDDNVHTFPLKAKRYLVHDQITPGLAVRIGKSRRTYVLVARFDGHTSRRSLGTVGKISVATARQRAQRMHCQLEGEHDPTITFAEVCKQLFHHIRKQRSAEELERALRRDAAPLFPKAIASITKRDIIALLEAKGDKRSAAHHLYAYLRRAFAFAVDRDIIEHNVCARIKPQQLLGAKAIRTRVLNDQELRRIWSACDQLGSPHGDAVRLILLTGMRRSECANARVREFDLINRTLTLSADRVKSGAQHVVPLAPTALKILSSAMAATGNEFVWGYQLRGFSKIKKRLDKFIAEDGEGEMAHWTYHDGRRTFRTRLSGLDVQEHVAELAINHAKKGLARVYDQHRHEDALRAAFERWHDELLRIVRAPRARLSEPALATTLPE